MKLRTIFAGTAIAALALFTSTGVPPGIFSVSQAEAAVSISFSLFYDDLEPHGDWVRYRDAYVFIPASVGADWRPYTVGHWVYTDRYGWTWVSEEPFGWATYHYGRWGYADDIGWYWVPGNRWAPAWVSWRRSNDYIVWAPLPPSGGGVDVSVSISVGDIPEFYWVAVPARQFLAPDIHVVVVREEVEIREVIERTEFVGAPRITNNIVVNNMIDIDVVAKATGKEVKTVEVRETGDPRKAKATSDQVTVFEGEVTAEENAKPKNVREVNEVKKAKRGGAKDDAAETQPIPEPDAVTGTTAAPETDTGQPAAKTAEEPDAKNVEEPAAKTAEEPAAKTKKAEEPAAKTGDQQQPAKKKATGQAEEQPEQDEATGTTTAPEAQQPAQAEQEDAQEQGQGKAGQKKQDQDKKDCDPAKDPGCEAAQ
jgi:hypothetical protein